jgi:uncharacterized protein (DUF362 family)
MSDPYRPAISRREALQRLSSAAVAAAAVGAGAVAFHDRRRITASATSVPDWRLPLAQSLSRAAASRGADPATNVRRAIAALGGMERFVRPGETVLIKPNIGWDRLPEQAANTDPAVVAELVRLAHGAGAGRVLVTDISCNDPRRCFARSGIASAATAAGAEVIESHLLTMVLADLSGLASGIEAAAQVLHADRVINVPVVKHHSLSKVTLGMKNWFGILGQGRNRLHQDINRALVELAATFRPTLTVMDATRVLFANGPVGGSLGDVKQVNAVAVGVDPVALDAWGAAILGHEPQHLAFLVDAEQRGIGRADPTVVRELGAA